MKCQNRKNSEKAESTNLVVKHDWNPGEIKNMKEPDRGGSDIKYEQLLEVTSFKTIQSEQLRKQIYSSMRYLTKQLS